ncbi:MAG: serine hydroxymethyltransferase [Planctomycetota bacterium]
MSSTRINSAQTKAACEARSRFFVDRFYPNTWAQQLALWERDMPRIASSLRRHTDRYSNFINLIASECLPSEAVLSASGSLFMSQTVEGERGSRWFPCTDAIDEIEDGISRSCETLFGLECASAQPHTATQANQAVMYALVEPGARVMSLSLSDGGHLSHGYANTLASSSYEIHPYHVAPDTGLIDYDALELHAKRLRPQMIITGSSTYPRAIDYKRVSSLCAELGSVHLADITHPAGMVCSGLHPAVDSADVVTLSLHKTMCGNRGGLICSKPEHGPAIRRAVFPGIQSAALPNMVLAKAISLLGATRCEFGDLQARIRSNAVALAEALVSLGHEVWTGGTDSHLVMLKAPAHLPALECEERLAGAGILSNRNLMPGDSKVGTGLRLGTIAVTQIGFAERDMRQTARTIDLALSDGADLSRAREDVAQLLDRVLCEARDGTTAR